MALDYQAHLACPEAMDSLDHGEPQELPEDLGLLVHLDNQAHPDSKEPLDLLELLDSLEDLDHQDSGDSLVRLLVF